VEEALPQLLPTLSTASICSLLWASARLEVQPDEVQLEAVVRELVRPGYRSATAAASTRAAPPSAVVSAWQQQPDPFQERLGSHAQASTSGSTSSTSVSPPNVYSYSRLQLASPRDLGALAFALNFFKFNHPVFWVAAAEAALPELPGLAPNVLTNLLTGVAHSAAVAARAEVALASTTTTTTTITTTTTTSSSSSSSSSSTPASSSSRPASSLQRAPGALAATPMVAAPVVAELFTAAAAMLTEEPQRLHRFRPRDLASLLAAYATAGQPAPALFAEVTRQVMLDDTGRRLAALRARDAALMAWACVHMLCADQQLLGALAGVLRRRAAQLAPHHAALVLWSYAAAGHRHEDMLRAVCAAAAGSMHSVHAPVAASVAWALGRLGFEGPALMEDALDRLAGCMGHAAWQHAGESSSSGDSGGGGVGGVGVGVGEVAAEATPAEATAAAAAADAGFGGRDLTAASVLEQLLHQPELTDGFAAPDSDETPRIPPTLPAAPAAARSSSGSSSDSHAAAAAATPPGSAAWMLAFISGTTAPPPMLPEDAAHALWACGRLRHWNGAFLAALRGRLPLMLSSGALSDAHVVSMLWACARLNYTNRSMLGPLCDEVRRPRGRLSVALTGALLLLGWLCLLRQPHPSTDANNPPYASILPQPKRSWHAAAPACPPVTWPSAPGQPRPCASTTLSCCPASQRAPWHSLRVAG